MANLVPMGVAFTETGAAQLVNANEEVRRSGMQAAEALDRAEDQTRAYNSQAAMASRSGSRLSGALGSLGNVSGATAAKLQQTSFQLQDIVVQTQMTGNFVRALSIQLPQLAGAWGAVGAAIGLVAGLGLGAFDSFRQAAGAAKDSTDDWKASLDDLNPSLDSVRGSMSALRRIQDQYNDAINAQGGASSAAASAVIANSEAEFSARKRVLEIEVEILRLRSQDQVQAIANLQEQARVAGQAAAENARTFRSFTPLDPFGEFVNLGVRTEDDLNRFMPPGFIGSGAERRRELDFERAQLELTNIAIDEATRLLDTDFGSLGAAGGGTNRGRTRRGGGGGVSEAEKALNDARREGERITDRLRTSSERYADEAERLKELLDAGHISQETYERGLADLNERYVESAKTVMQLGETIDSELLSAFQRVRRGSETAGEALLAFANNVLDEISNRLFQRNFGGIGTGIADFLVGTIPGLGGLGAGAAPAAGIQIGGASAGLAGPAPASQNFQIVNQVPGAEIQTEQNAQGGVDFIVKAVAGNIAAGGEVNSAIRRTFGARNQLARR